MKELFPEFYRADQSELERLVRDGQIILDTSAVLSIYKFPVESQREALAVLQSLRSRIWIPFQVALEYQFNRLTVIASEKKKVDSARASIETSVDRIKKTVQELEFSKQQIATDVSSAIPSVDTAVETLFRAIDEVQAKQISLTGEDPIRNALDEIFNGSVGPAPSSQEELNGLLSDGEERYDKKIPPGFEDVSKERGDAAEFVHDGIVYPKKFGDLIVWKQILSHLRADNVQRAVLITQEKKQDWWEIVGPYTIGPHPKLRRECAAAGCSEFWIYSLPELLTYAKQLLSAPISDESLAEIREVADRDARLRALYGGGPPYFPAGLVDSIRAVVLWVQRRGFGVEVPHGDFPTFVAEGGRGYEVLEKFRFDDPREGNTFSTPQLRRLFERGRRLIEQGSLANFTVVALVDDVDFARVTEHLEEYSMEAYVSADGAYTALVVGHIVSGDFVELFRVYGGGLEREHWVS